MPPPTPKGFGTACRGVATQSEYHAGSSLCMAEMSETLIPQICRDTTIVGASVQASDRQFSIIENPVACLAVQNDSHLLRCDTLTAI